MAKSSRIEILLSAKDTGLRAALKTGQAELRTSAARVSPQILTAGRSPEENAVVRAFMPLPHHGTGGRGPRRETRAP